MRLRHLVTPLVSTALAAGLALQLGGVPAQAADPEPAVAVTPLTFKVKVGPTGAQTCLVTADLYVPASVTATNRAPAILTTNGFGGSKADQAGLAQYFAKRGYVALAYSGLGFGGSSCTITLDDPQVDGKAASQLISYLGGATGIAFTDAKATVPAPALDRVRLDAPGDPRVGMIGISYGGAVQLATASIDQRLDTIVPGATWNDLSYSLAPNNTGQLGPDQVSTLVPGAAKLVWTLGFFAKGVAAGLEGGSPDLSRLLPCPNFVAFACPSVVTGGLTGTLTPDTAAQLRARSFAGYGRTITAPTLLLQGQNDTLFNLNESVATFQALRRQGTPVKLMWVNGGHSGPMAPGEIDFTNPDYQGQYVTRRVTDWMDHYLRDTGADTGPLFSWFRDWVGYTGSAEPAYASSQTFPVGRATQFYLSGNGNLTTGTPQPGRADLTTTLAGLPTSLGTIDVLGPAVPLPEGDTLGTSGQWTSPALTAPLDVVGSPRVRLQVTSPLAQLLQGTDATKVVLFLRIMDVAPDGTTTHVRNLTAPVRIPDVGKPFTVTMPGFVHRFAAGHSVRLVVAGGSINYRGGLVSYPVSIAVGSTGQSLTLPTVD